MFIVIDTETTGLPDTPSFGEWYSPSHPTAYDTSRVIQIAAVSATEEHVWYVQPLGFTINNSQFHGITTEHAQQYGKPFPEVIKEFRAIVDKYDTVVGHNVAFDIHVLQAELHRHNLEEWTPKDVQCTMAIAKEHYNRQLKLSTLYQRLFNKSWVQAHDAKEDCHICFDCYVTLMDLPLKRQLKTVVKSEE
jgi:DNA polymerase-3 subunit alpha